MIEKDIQVINKLGLHARASARVVHLLNGYESQVFLTCRGREINAKSIMGLMMLAAGCGSTISMRVEGSDEQDVADAMTALFERRFDEHE